MKNFVYLMLLILFSAHIMAGTPVRRLFQDVKLPTQGVLEHQSWTAPATTSTGYIFANLAISSTAAVTKTTGITNPDVARNILIQTDTSTASVSTCSAVVTGTNYFDQSINETITVSTNSAASFVGNKAFKTVSSVAFPASCANSPYTATWSVGVGTKLGLKRCMSNAGQWVFGIANSAYESTRATIASSTSSVESNTSSFNTAPNAVKNFEGYFIQNFSCFP